MTRSLAHRFVVLLVALALAGCGGGSTSQPATQSTQQTAASASSTPPALTAAQPTGTPTDDGPPLLGAPAPGGAIAFQPPGVTYNGMHSTTTPTSATVTADLTTAKAHFQSIRTYYPQFNGSVDVDQIANNQGLKVLLGLYIFADHPEWTESNYNDFVKPAIGRGNVLGVLVGNEDPQDLATIIKYINRIKTDFPTVPVSTAQTSEFWLSNSGAAQVAPLVDFIAVNIYPEWEWSGPVSYQPAISGNPVTPAAGFQSFKSTYASVSGKYSPKQTVVTETGWPTTYGWVVNTTPPPQPAEGISNAKAYLGLVMDWANQTSTNVYIYSLFDDLYAVNTSSQYNFHFGLIDYNGNPKGVLF